jgi:hypothetical protein
VEHRLEGGAPWSWFAFRDGVLDDELTAAVLEARRGPARAWPSGVCPGVHWVSERKAAGVTVEARGSPLPAVVNGWPQLGYVIAVR